MQAWRKKGPLGKLYNINIQINRTEQRLQTFLRYSHNRRIPHDNKTRWNSWQKEIERATNEEMMAAIDEFLDAYGDGQIELDKLEEEEQETLEKINIMLLVLKETTKSLEGSVVSLTKGLLAIDYILTKFEDRRAQYRDNTIMAPLYQSGQEKMKKYYDLTDESPTYTAVMVLHLSFKWQYIQDNQEPAWLPKAEVNTTYPSIYRANLRRGSSNSYGSQNINQLLLYLALKFQFYQHLQHLIQFLQNHLLNLRANSQTSSINKRPRHWRNLMILRVVTTNTLDILRKRQNRWMT